MDLPIEATFPSLAAGTGTGKGNKGGAMTDTEITDLNRVLGLLFTPDEFPSVAPSYLADVRPTGREGCR